MYSFYGGQKGQDFKITRIFSNRAVDMLGDLKQRWTSPVGVGDYVFINYGDPSFMNEETSNYNINLQIDLKDCGKSYTNSLWQKIYVDKNLTISPDFPESDNNIYIFLNLDESSKEEYGESLKEVSDIESEECFGFAYRLIACVTGVTPRIQVFHQTIDIEDGDPYATLDLTNPDTPKIKFYLQRGQRIEDVYKNIVGSQVKPDVRLITDGRTYIDKNGEIKTATLTRPQLVFDLPKAPTFYSGMLFGQGPLPYFHNVGNLTDPTSYATSDVYKVYYTEVKLISRIGYELRDILKNDEINYTVNSNGDITFIDQEHFFFSRQEETNKDDQNKMNELSKSTIYSQNGIVYFNPFNGKNAKKNAEIVEKFYKTLSNDFSVSREEAYKFNDEGKEDLYYDYYWINKSIKNSEVPKELIANVIDRTFPNTLFPLSTIISKIINYIFDTIINNNGKSTWSEENTYESLPIGDYNTADYLLGILSLSTLLKTHYDDIAINGYEADYYINEPTGKLYMISKIINVDGYEYIEGKYLGTITAPAPYATVENKDAFIEEDGFWVRNQPSVRSNIGESIDSRVYQEEFIFNLVKNPKTSVKVNQVSNDRATFVSSPVGINENEQQITIDSPQPIHIFTPSGTNNGLKINDGGKITWDSKLFNNVLFGKGDLFINVIPLNITEKANAYRGDVYRYTADPVQSLDEQKNITNFSDKWEKIGNINGVPGVPAPTKIVNIILDPSSSTSSTLTITYKGKKYKEEEVEGSSVYNFLINKAPDETNSLLDIIKRILEQKNIAFDTSSLELPDLTVDSLKGEIVLINYYSEIDNIPSTYWGIYTQYSLWDVISFAGGSSSFLSTKSETPTAELAKSQAYSVYYMEDAFITDHFSWHEIED